MLCELHVEPPPFEGPSKVAFLKAAHVAIDLVVDQGADPETAMTEALASLSADEVLLLCPTCWRASFVSACLGIEP